MNLIILFPESSARSCANTKTSNKFQYFLTYNTFSYFSILNIINIFYNIILKNQASNSSDRIYFPGFTAQRGI